MIMLNWETEAVLWKLAFSEQEVLLERVALTRDWEEVLSGPCANTWDGGVF